MIRNLLRRVISKKIVLPKHSSTFSDFTKNLYKVQRGMFQTLEEEHVDFFRSILDDNRIIMDLSDLEGYNVDWMKHLRGNSKLLLKPRTTDEISKILSYCNQNRLAVCPQGGNTSIVGGGVPVLDEIIISTSLLNNIIQIDDTSGVIVCESGCILEKLEEEAAKHNLSMPLDLGSKGSCQIGGNVSSNAGGLRLLRYGNLHGNILGLEVVKANGEILDLLSTLKKDNTGYHLKHLFIGSEGTLGFVTKVAIQCPTKSKACNLAFLGLQSYEKVLKTFKQARADLGEILSAVEVIDAATAEFVHCKLGIKPPIGDYPFYLMIETLGSNTKHDEEKLNAFLDFTLVKFMVLNGTVSSEPSKIKEIWNYRERLAESFNKSSYVFSYDFTFPLKDYFTLVDEFRMTLGEKVEKVFGFGHLGDGNLHLQIAVKEYSRELQDLIEKRLYKRVKDLNGSISAEHGIGFVKSKPLKDFKNESSLKLMKDLKILFDPNGILNPYKVINDE